MSSATLPPFLEQLAAQLRRRRLQVGIDDMQALRVALRAGFGLSSRDALRELCVSLWAKSPVEAEIVRAVFARLDKLGEWKVSDQAERLVPRSGPQALPTSSEEQQFTGTSPRETSQVGDAAKTVAVRNLGAGPGVGLEARRAGASDRGLVLVPQYPLTSREVAQAWRHLRRPVRTGPPVELDIAATIRERGRRGVATPPVLVPKRRNAVRLLMLIDRHGSMTPFHGYVDHVVAAIQDAGRIDDVHAAYFHDLPGSVENKAALEQMDDPFRPDLDGVLGLIDPLRGGRVYDDPGLTAPRMLDAILAGAAPATAILVISDAGAARRQFDIVRLLDTVALVKALRAVSGGVAWLNPAPPGWWPRTTAGQLARYVPMFELSRRGLGQAVDALRGRPVFVERPV
ncbi:MAG: VWA domain-containing protein [Streptosporangiaceae bacterium]